MRSWLPAVLGSWYVSALPLHRSRSHDTFIAIIFDLWIGGLGCYKFLKRFLRPQNTEDRAEIFSIFLRDR